MCGRVKPHVASPGRRLNSGILKTHFLTKILLGTACTGLLLATAGCLVADGGRRGRERDHEHERDHDHYERHADVIVAPPVLVVRPPIVIVR